jgi:hypothetical protein
LALAWFLKHGGFHARREKTPYTGDRAASADDDRKEDPVDVGSDEGSD